MSDREEEDPLVELAAREAMRTGRVVHAVRDAQGERLRYGKHFNPEMQGPVPPECSISQVPVGRSLLPPRKISGLVVLLVSALLFVTALILASVMVTHMLSVRR